MHQEAQVMAEGRGCLLSQGRRHGELQTGWGGECGQHWLMTDVVGWWGRVVRDTRDEEGGYKGDTEGGDTHWYAGRWPSQGG